MKATRRTEAAATKKLTVDIPEEVHRRLAVLAAIQGTRMNALAGKFLDQSLRRFDADREGRRKLAELLGMTAPVGEDDRLKPSGS